VQKSRKPHPEIPAQFKVNVLVRRLRNVCRQAFAAEQAARLLDWIGARRERTLLLVGHRGALEALLPGGPKLNNGARSPCFPPYSACPR
jgi:hypothetical protein